MENLKEVTFNIILNGANIGEPGEIVGKVDILVDSSKTKAEMIEDAEILFYSEWYLEPEDNQ